MNFTEIVAEVQRITKRPDLILDIKREVNAAVNFCCIEGNFARDKDENIYPIDSTLYAQSLSLDLFPRWRKFDYIKPATQNRYLEHLEAPKIFNPSGRETINVFYVVGNNVNFKMGQLDSNLLIGYSKYPPLLTDASPLFWLLEVSPFMIIAKAAAEIFSTVGNPTEKDSHLATFATLYTSAERDYKRGVSYG